MNNINILNHVSRWAVFLLLGAGGCSPEIPNGQVPCRNDTDCAALGWRCRPASWSEARVTQACFQSRFSWEVTPDSSSTRTLKVKHEETPLVSLDLSKGELKAVPGKGYRFGPGVFTLLYMVKGATDVRKHTTGLEVRAAGEDLEIILDLDRDKNDRLWGRARYTVHPPRDGVLVVDARMTAEPDPTLLLNTEVLQDQIRLVSVDTEYTDKERCATESVRLGGATLTLESLRQGYTKNEHLYTAKEMPRVDRFHLDGGCSSGGLVSPSLEVQLDMGRPANLYLTKDTLQTPPKYQLSVWAQHDSLPSSWSFRLTYR